MSKIQDPKAGDGALSARNRRQPGPVEPRGGKVGGGLIGEETLKEESPSPSGEGLFLFCCSLALQQVHINV